MSRPWAAFPEAAPRPDAWNAFEGHGALELCSARSLHTDESLADCRDGLSGAWTINCVGNSLIDVELTDSPQGA